MNWLRQYLASRLIRGLFAPIDPNELLRITPGLDGVAVYLGKRELSDGDIQNLKNEAKMLTGNEAWKIVTAELRRDAEEKMVMKALPGDGQLIFGKAMLYNLKVIDDTLERIKSL